MMIRISDYIQAIRERCPSFKGRVAGASAWAVDALVKVEAPDLPAAYVVLENEQGGEYTLNGEYLQNVDVSLAVIVLVANQNNEELRGQGDLEQIDKIRGELFRGILFWSPDPKHLENSPMTVQRSSIWILRGWLIASISKQCTAWTTAIRIKKNSTRPIRISKRTILILRKMEFPKR